MEFDGLFSLQMQLIFGGLFLLFSGIVVSEISGKDAHPNTVFCFGIILIVLSAAAIWYIDALSENTAKFIEEKRLSENIYNNFQRNSKLFLFVFPFVTAAIGTNLLTEVITRNFKFQEGAGALDALKGLFCVIGNVVIWVVSLIFKVSKFASLLVLTSYSWAKNKSHFFLRIKGHHKVSCRHFSGRKFPTQNFSSNSHKTPSGGERIDVS
ncbi:hypothetical protein ACXR5E_000912 [Vibrio mimicus]